MHPHISIWSFVGWSVGWSVYLSIRRSACLSVRQFVRQSVCNAFFQILLNVTQNIGNDRELNDYWYGALWRSRIIPISKIICPISEKKNLMDASLFWLKIVYLLSAISEYFDTHESCQLIHDIGCPKKLPCLIKRCIWSNKGSLQHVNFRCILASLYEALSIRRFVYPSVHLCNTGKSRSRWSGIIRNQMKTNMRPNFISLNFKISEKPQLNCHSFSDLSRSCTVYFRCSEIMHYGQTDRQIDGWTGKWTNEQMIFEVGMIWGPLRASSCRFSDHLQSWFEKKCMTEGPTDGWTDWQTDLQNLF